MVLDKLMAITNQVFFTLVGLVSKCLPEDDAGLGRLEKGDKHGSRQ